MKGVSFAKQKKMLKLKV